MSFAQSSIVATPDWGVRVEITPYTYIITFRPSEFSVATDTLNDYGNGNSMDIMQSVPHGVYIIYDSSDNKYTKIIK